MNKVTNSIIETLMQYEGDRVLSLYIPTHRFPTPPNVQEDQIRYKNMIRLGYEKWQGHDDNDAKRKTFQLLESVIDDLDFWQHTIESLAVFASQDGIKLYYLPIDCEERIFVGPTYDITPLLLLKEINQPFYVFALAAHNSKLFRGDMYNLEPVEINFPASPEAALKIDEMYSAGKSIRSRESTGGAAASGSSRGQGEAIQAVQEERRKYFRLIDKLIIKSTKLDSKRPFLIATTGSKASDYKAVSKLPNLVATHIRGNYTMAKLQDLHLLAWRMIQANVVYPMMQLKVAQFKEMWGLQKASRDLDDIIRAAKAERVDNLMMCLLDLETNTETETTNDALYIRYFKGFDLNDILPLVRSVAKQGGSIMGIDRALLPHGTTVAAIYRY
ncbi:MAG: hypothetical protein ABI716_00265 [Candidatus Saccharibacteria bacterium]